MKEVPASIMIEKRWPDVLTLSKTFYDLSVSRNLPSMAEMRRFGASGGDGLSPRSLGRGPNFDNFVRRQGLEPQSGS